MARKMTPAQLDTVTRLRDGMPPNASHWSELRGVTPLPIVTFEHSVMPEAVLCHRVVSDGSQLGRTELFRIARDGFATQH